MFQWFLNLLGLNTLATKGAGIVLALIDRLRGGDGSILMRVPGPGTRIETSPDWMKIDPSRSSARTSPDDTKATRDTPPVVIREYSDIKEMRTSTPPPDFVFSLHGDKARGALVQTETDFELRFDYRPPRPEDLITLLGEDLDKVVARDLDLEIAIVTRGLTIRDGVFLKVAEFREGALTNEIAFQLRAGPPDAQSGVHVFFSTNGCLLYNFPLAVHVVDDLQTALDIDLTHEVRRLNLDALRRVQQRQQRRVRLVFNKIGSQIEILYHDLTKPKLRFDLRTLDTGVWANLLKQTAGDARDIADRAFWNRMADPLKAPSDAAVRNDLHDTLDRLVTAGSQLHKALTSDDNLAWVIAEIEQLPPDSRISVVSNCGFLPFEILYPEEYHYSFETPRTASQLWGYRFQFEHLPWSESPHQHPQSASPRGSRFISLNLDPWIDAQLTADTLTKPPFLPGQKHDAFAVTAGAAGWEMETNQSLDGVKKTLQTAHDASLIYYYCHGKADTPFAERGTASIAFGTDTIDPAWIKTRPFYPDAPIIVLNSCSSGESGPLSLLTFLDAFQRKGAAGVISTWFSVPVLFAAAFGCALMERYSSDTNPPIGEILLGLRRELLNHDNPLGFFYALQCPLDLRAPVPRTKAA